MYSPQEALDDPHVVTMGYHTSRDYPGMATPAPIMEAPFRLSRTPPTIRTRPPTIGEHTDQVLHAIGYDPATIRALREKRVI